MTTTELVRRRHDLHTECRQVFTHPSADELVSALPPPGLRWEDVATKADLAALATELRGEMAVGFAQVRQEVAEGFRRQQTWMLTTIVSVTSLSVTSVGIALAALLR